MMNKMLLIKEISSNLVNFNHEFYVFLKEILNSKYMNSYMK